MNRELELEDDLDLSAIYNSANIQPVESVTDKPKRGRPKTTNTSFSVVEQEQPTAPTKRRFITRQARIDKFNVSRRRVELTPSVCDVCAFDVAEKYFGSWHQVPLEEREKIQKALEMHKKTVHTTADNLIVDEDELPTKWLGGGKL